MSDMFGVGTAAAAGINAAANIGIAGMNNVWAAKREKTARAENYKYGEMAADSADARTRALYNDLYSPQAQLQQIKDAGLSPSLFYGDGGGISGQAGAQGSGAAGVSPTTFGAPPLELGEIFKTIAETGLIKAETDKVKKETTGIDLENEIKEINNEVVKDTMFLLRSVPIDVDGKPAGKSLYEMADESKTYQEFNDKVSEMYKNAMDADGQKIVKSEIGQQILRDIYMAGTRMDHDVKVLSAEGVDADFQKRVIQILKNKGGEQQSADTMFSQMQAAAEGADLTKEQKQSWNNIIERLRKWNSTAADILIVLSLIVNQAASNWSLPTVRFNHNNSTSTNRSVSTNYNFNKDM